MNKVLIGLGAAVVLAGALFAIVRFSSPREPAPTPQNGWVSVVIDMKRHPPMVRVDRYYGSWRLICRDMPLRGGQIQQPATGNLVGASQSPKPKPLCAVVLLMMREPSGVAPKQPIRLSPGKPFAPEKWLNLGFQRPATGSGAIATLAYAHNPGEKPSAGPGSAVEQIGLKADANTIGLTIRNCARGRCFARNELTPSDLASLRSAQRLAILFPPSQVAGEVILPTDGLKAALTALGRPTAD